MQVRVLGPDSDDVRVVEVPQVDSIDSAHRGLDTHPFLDAAKVWTALQEFDGDLKIPSYTKAGLPAAGTAGRIARVTDDVRGTWMDQGSQWFSLFGEAVYVRNFGATGDGSTDDSAAVDNAISAAQGKTLVFESGYTFEMNRPTTFTQFSGVRRVIAYGATIQNTRVAFGGDDVAWMGGIVDQGSGSFNDPMVDVRASNVRLYDILAKPAAGAAEVGFKIRDNGGAQISGVWVQNCETQRPSDGKASLEIRDCKNVHVINYRGSGGADDGVVVKSINAKTENVYVNGVQMQDHATIFAIGDQCAVGIENISFNNGEGFEINKAINFRPGKDEAVGSGDCRNIRVNGVVVIDSDGSKMKTPIVLHAGDGATLEGVSIDNLQIWGRFGDATDNFLANIAGLAVGDTVRNISITDYRFTDPEGGVSSASAAGTPAGAIRDSSNSGTIDDITFERLYINGFPNAKVVAWSGGLGTAGTIRFIDPVFTNFQGTTTILESTAGELYLDGGDFPSSADATSFNIQRGRRPVRSFTKQEFFPTTDENNDERLSPIRLVPQTTPPSSLRANGDLWYDNGSNELRLHRAGTGDTLASLGGSHTFSGNNTFSGDNTFSGLATFTNRAALERGSGGSPALSVKVNGDADFRVLWNADGTILWGSGAASGDRDTNLYRGAADLLRTDDTFDINNAGGLQVQGTKVVGTQHAAIAKLNQTISSPPTQAEVQAISDKVDELIDALNGTTGSHGLVAPPA